MMNYRTIHSWLSGFLFALNVKWLYFWGLFNEQNMVFYVDLQPKDNPKCRFRGDVYTFLQANGYKVISAAKPYSKIDTSAKTAIDVETSTQLPIINERTSWAYFRNLILS